MSTKSCYIYRGFKCNEHVISSLYPEKWCEHFMEKHLQKYENSSICHLKNCGYKYKMLHDAVIHYKTVHLKFHAQCFNCYSKFSCIPESKFHETNGCGIFTFCYSCEKWFYGLIDVEKHKIEYKNHRFSDEESDDEWYS